MTLYVLHIISILKFWVVKGKTLKAESWLVVRKLNHWPLNGRWQHLSAASGSLKPAPITSYPRLSAISWMQQETDEGARQFPFCSNLTSFLCSLLPAYCKGKSWNTSQFPSFGSSLGQGRKSKFLRLVNFPL